MPIERASVFELSQIGPESVIGVPTPATKRLQSLSIVPEIKTKTTPFKPQGWKYNATLSVDQEWTEAKATGIADYAALPYPLSGLFGAVTPTTPTGAVLARQRQWIPTNSTAETPLTFTIESGSNVRAGKFSYGLFKDFGVNYTRQDVKVDGALLGQRYTDGITLTTAPSEAQSLVATGATAGTFTLTFNGQTTAPIAYNATAAAVVTALTALSSIGAGGVTATGGPLPTTPVVITFAAGLSGTRQALLVPNSALLTGGPAAVTETTPGGMDLQAVPIFPTQNTLYIDSSAANLGTTALTRPFDYSWKMTGKWDAVWPINAINTSFATHTELAPKTDVKLTLEADASGMTYLSTFRAGASIFLRMNSVGPLIETGIYHTYNADFCGKITAINPFKDSKGVWAIDYTLEEFQDATWGASQMHTIINAVAAL